jgi:drug/metabolite transporter (DMT)-like permease
MQQHTKVYLIMLLVPLFWGGAFAAAKHAVTEIPPFTIAALRFGAAGLILTVWLLYKKKWEHSLLKSRLPGLIVMSLTGVFAYNAFFFIGLQYTSATNGALVIATTPVVITLGAVLFLSENWNIPFIVGMILSLTGVLVVISRGSIDSLLSLSLNVGDLWLLGSMISWATYGIVGKTVMKGLSPYMTTAVTMLIGSFALFIGSLLFENGWKLLPEISFQTGTEIFYMILFASVIGFLLWNDGVHQIGASKAGAYLNFVPIHAMWISALFYGAEILVAQIIGMFLVISGVLLTVQGGKLESLRKSWKKAA